MRWKSVLSALALAIAVIVTPGAWSSAEAANSYVSLSSSSINFGTVQVGASDLKNLQVTNVTSSTVYVDTAAPTHAAFTQDQVSAPDTPRAGACWYDGSGGHTRTQIDPGQSCLLYYRFTPTAAGTFNASSALTVYDFVGSPLDHDTITLTGTGQTVTPPHAATSGSATVTPTSAAFGSVNVDESKTLVLTIKNTSNGNVQLKPTYPAGKPFADAAHQGGDCWNASVSLVLATNDTCTIRPTFTPTAGGSFSGNLSIGIVASSGQRGEDETVPGSTPLATKAVSMSGTGVAAAFTVSPTSASFGNVTLTQTKKLTITVKNTSKVPLSFTVTDPNDAFSLDIPTGGTGHCIRDNGGGMEYWGVAVNATCDLTVTFSPFTAGAAKATYVINAYRAAATGTYVTGGTGVSRGTKNLSATGSGVAPTFTVTPSPLAFGNVTLTDSKQLTAVVKNTSAVSLNFGFETTGDDYELVPATANAGHCIWEDGQSTYHLGVGPGQSCDVVLKFRPFTAGSDPGTLKVGAYELSFHQQPGGGTNGLGGDPLATKTVNATGSGVAPTFTVTPSPLAFGNVNAGGSKRLTAVVKNTSDVKVGYAFGATGDYKVVPGADNQGHCVWKDPQLGLYHLGVASGGSCDVVLEFKPTKAGSAPGTLKIEAYEWPNFGGAESVQSLQGDPLATKTVNASGTGVAPTFTITPTSYNFGSVRTAESKRTMVEVHNTSTVTLQVSVDDVAPFWAVPGAVPFGGQLPEKPACFATDWNFQLERFQLKPGASCWVSVDFLPSAGGAVTRSVPFHVYTGFEEEGGTYSMAGALTPALATKNLSASGTGVAPTWTVSPTSVGFGNVTAGATKTSLVTVKNTSDRVLQVNATATGAGFSVKPGGVVFGGNSRYCKAVDQFDADTAYSYQLGPGDECDLLIDFNPTTTGSRSGKVDVKVYPGDPDLAGGYADGEASGTVLGTKSVSLSGNGVAPTFTITPTSYNFGSVISGNSKTTMVEVHNTSTVVVAVSVDDAAPFFAAGGPINDGGPLPAQPFCFGTNLQFQDETFQLAPAKSCWVRVSFSPTVAGSKSAAVPFHIHAGNQDLGGTYTMAGPMTPVVATKNFSASGNGVH